MSVRTLVFLTTEEEVYLAKKKDGRFGAGRYNGYGGGRQEDERILQTAIRELEEESGIVAKEEDLMFRGRIQFCFPREYSNNDQVVMLYELRNFQGEPKETDEMHAPEKFSKTRLPLDEMWPADQHWLPYVLNGDKVEAAVYFEGNGKKMKRIAFSKPEEKIIDGD
jgi:8-oxo-dGTP pyrophosphatase MutT (NUDIX family)